MTDASTAEANRVISQSLYTRYRLDSPLRRQEAVETTPAVVRRVSDTVRRDGFARSIAAEKTASADTVRRFPAPAASALIEGGFGRISDVVSQAGAGRLRAGALFGTANPLDTTTSLFGEALQTPQDTGELEAEFRSAAAWYRQAGPLRLQQGILLPSPQVYTRQESAGVNAILTTALSDTSIRAQYFQTEQSLYADNGTLYEQTPRLLNSLFA